MIIMKVFSLNLYQPLNKNIFSKHLIKNSDHTINATIKRDATAQIHVDLS